MRMIQNQKNRKNPAAGNSKYVEIAVPLNT